MNRKLSFPDTRSAYSPYNARAGTGEFFLPLWNSAFEKPRLRMRSVLGHGLYRRVVIFAIVSLLLLTVLLVSTQERSLDGRLSSTWSLADRIPDENVPRPAPETETETEIVTNGDPETDSPSSPEIVLDQNSQPENSGAGTPEEVHIEEGPHWLKFPLLNAFFFGLKSLVPASKHTPEYPNPDIRAPVEAPISDNRKRTYPKPTPYNPYKSDDLNSHRAADDVALRCFLDPEEKVPIPDLYAYQGLPQYHPDPVLGSYKLLGIRDDVCFDRFGRFGPYGLGYAWNKGGTGEGLGTESQGNEAVWENSGQINYASVDWADAQRRCRERNSHRFATPDEVVAEAAEIAKGGSPLRNLDRAERTAVVIRVWAGFEWTHHVVLNIRALISELSLKTGGEYDVHFLLHVKDENLAIWSDSATAQKLIEDAVPDEFRGLCTLWSEAQMRLYYPGDWDNPGSIVNPSGAAVRGVYRSAHMPLQLFARDHPEYTQFWNWEMDLRYTGSFFELFDRLSSWAEAQPRNHMWERSGKYYIPSVHGTWENFTKTVERETALSQQSAIFDSVHFQGRKRLRFEEDNGSFLPDNCGATNTPTLECGVGEPADLITLNPLFDAEASGWVFASDVTNYPRNSYLPRRSAIITASRLSRRLLSAMHEENWRHHHDMFSEMYPASIALHHGLKAVFGPHPVYLDRAWEPNAIEATFNGGRDGSSGGHGSPFDLRHEHNHKGSTWYYNSEFSGMLWRRWLGYAQIRMRSGQDGTWGGGKEEEEKFDGRMCLRSMLIHPIKIENPTERD